MSYSIGLVDGFAIGCVFCGLIALGARIHTGRWKWTCDLVSRGWFVHLSGSYEAIHVGDEKPAFEVGQPVTITLEPSPLPCPSASPS